MPTAMPQPTQAAPRQVNRAAPARVRPPVEVQAPPEPWPALLETAGRRLSAATAAAPIPDPDAEDALAEVLDLARALGPRTFRRRELQRESRTQRSQLLTSLRLEVVRAALAGGAAEPYALLETLDALDRVSDVLNEEQADKSDQPAVSEAVLELAHEMRSPLTSILFLAETLQQRNGGEVSDVQNRQLRIIYSAALGLISMASDVIELGQGGDRLASREAEHFSVTDVLESTSELVMPLAEEKGLAIRIISPAADQRIGHPVALSRVLLNLTTNAIKFTDDGFVEIAVKQTGLNRLHFSVRDTGRGLDSQAVSSLSQAVGRVNWRKENCFPGAGLGLVICRKLVAAMGSELKFDTTPGLGTRVHFELELPTAAWL
jgi:signal transduction histidine kinase